MTRTTSVSGSLQPDCEVGGLECDQKILCLFLMSQEIRTIQLVRKQIQTKLLYNLKAIKNNILLF